MGRVSDYITLNHVELKTVSHWSKLDGDGELVWGRKWSMKDLDFTSTLTLFSPNW